MQVLFKKTQIIRYILCRMHLSSLSGQANLVWACDDVVAYFSSSRAPRIRRPLDYHSRLLFQSRPATSKHYHVHMLAPFDYLVRFAK